MTIFELITIIIAIASIGVNAGVVSAKLATFEKRLDSFEKEVRKELRRVSKAINSHRYRIKRLEQAVFKQDRGHGKP